MRVQLVTKAKLEGLNAAFTTTINVLTAQVTALTTTTTTIRTGEVDQLGFHVVQLIELLRI